ncbi:MAG TPA: VWA domain-containing protein [bacterium]|nr:VWA domain-containing protein [bacterium]HPN44366.1 VWA domain-containing protein [bacterium]
MKRISLTIIALLITVMPVLADGLLIPAKPGYPQDFIQNRLTRVTVDIYGMLAVTTVYQEFFCESTDTIAAVYSFPLPPDARATEFLYWSNNKIYKAVLKVREQATNPGTGEGGIIALVNEYIGRNGIKISLQKVAPQTVQKVQLTYISNCDYFAGETNYTFPLNTGDFIKFPLDHVQFTFHVHSQAAITGYSCTSHQGLRAISADNNNLNLELIMAKQYLDRDLVFSYQCNQDVTGVDFYSVANDSVDGHFVLYVKPQTEITAENVLPKRILFLVNNSSQMFGYKLDQTIKAIKTMLDKLNTGDVFNIILYSSYYYSWNTAPVAANATNIDNAKSYLNSISSSSGSYYADQALKSALTQCADNNYNNMILVFTDGRSAIDPREIESLNTHKAGIFPVGIGDNVDRARLEMTAALNYGFVTYLDAESNIYTGMERLMNKISKPILQDVVFEFGRVTPHDLLPGKIPATFAGSSFYMTGRYQTTGSSAFSMAGTSPSGARAFDFNLDFSAVTNTHKFAEAIWAKEKIDALEWEIEIYGETPSLKNELIAISLAYNIRCRYTAYIADYEHELTDIEEQLAETLATPASYLIGNYPNPFNPITTIRFVLQPDDHSRTVKLLKIYNMLGQLVWVIDISYMEPGMHEIKFNGVDLHGNPLPSGLYFVCLQVGSEFSTLRMSLLK